jgi:hypothetical protein
MKEIHQLRLQLQAMIDSVSADKEFEEEADEREEQTKRISAFSGSSSSSSSTSILQPPSSQQLLMLRQFLTSALVDRVACLSSLQIDTSQSDEAPVSGIVSSSSKSKVYK